MRILHFSIDVKSLRTTKMSRGTRAPPPLRQLRQVPALCFPALCCHLLGKIFLLFLDIAGPPASITRLALLSVSGSTVFPWQRHPREANASGLESVSGSRNIIKNGARIGNVMHGRSESPFCSRNFSQLLTVISYIKQTVEMDQARFQPPPSFNHHMHIDENPTSALQHFASSAPAAPSIDPSSAILYVFTRLV